MRLALAVYTVREKHTLVEKISGRPSVKFFLRCGFDRQNFRLIEVCVT